MKKQIVTTLLASVLLACGSLVAAERDPHDIVKLDDGQKEPVLMVGDSMMRLLGKALEKDFKKENLKAVAFSSLGSGLARLDVFDWYDRLDSLMKEHEPKVVIVTLGTNDRQTLQDGKGSTVEFGTPEWRAEFGRRVGRVMDLILENGAERVIWLDLPDMKEHVHQDYANLANEIYIEQAKVDSRKDRVSLFPTRKYTSRKPGTYTSFLMSPQGQAIQYRDGDGVHLSQPGAKAVSKAILDAYWRKK